MNPTQKKKIYSKSVKVDPPLESPELSSLSSSRLIPPDPERREGVELSEEEEEKVVEDLERRAG